MFAKSVSYKCHRYPPGIIARAVWLYFRFPLSLRLVEEMLLERGIVVSYETIRRWARKFGPDYAKRFRRKPARPDDIWHLDEVVIRGDVPGRHLASLRYGANLVWKPATSVSSGAEVSRQRIRLNVAPSILRNSREVEAEATIVTLTLQSSF